MSKKAEFLGTCQVCFSMQKLPGEKLSIHGYERPGDGIIYDICEGSNNDPFEKSCELTKHTLEEYIRIRERLIKSLDEYTQESDSQDRVIRERIVDMKNQISRWTRHIEFIKGKIDKWKLSELIPVEEKQKYLIQYRFTGNTYIDYYKEVRNVLKPLNVWFDKKITDEEMIEQSIQTLYKEYKYEHNNAIFEARYVKLPEGHRLKKYHVSDYQD